MAEIEGRGAARLEVHLRKIYRAGGDTWGCACLETQQRERKLAQHLRKIGWSLARAPRRGGERARDDATPQERACGQHNGSGPVLAARGCSYTRDPQAPRG